jgi:hypothetical protein
MRWIKHTCQALNWGMAITIAVLFSGQARGTDPVALTAAEFEKLHRELQPPRDEIWRSIPWHVSLLEGREQAAREKKPIFVWVASGEPLACG